MENKLIKVKAELELFKGNDKRKTPFKSGYRPLFRLNERIHTSGQIDLMFVEKLYPGEECEVEICFVDYFTGLDFNFVKDQIFYFFEKDEPLGRVKILEKL